MSSLPTGTVTFLFIDIEGSTRLLQHFGARCAALLSECHQLLPDVAQEKNGQVVDTRGETAECMPLVGF